MAEAHQLSRTEARRIAVAAQLLTKDRPTGVLETVRRLSFVQVEPTSAVAPSADLVLWSRLGSAYDPQELRDAVDEQQLIELNMMLRPPEDLRLYTARELPDSCVLPWRSSGWTNNRNERRLKALGVARAKAAATPNEPFTGAMTAAVDRELADLARWLDLEQSLPA